MIEWYMASDSGMVHHEIVFLPSQPQSLQGSQDSVVLLDVQWRVAQAQAQETKLLGQTNPSLWPHQFILVQQIALDIFCIPLGRF
jgi:hypothetical protein